MEDLVAEIINNPKVPKVIKYSIITIVIGFLEFIFIALIITGKSVIAVPFGIIMASIFLILYIYIIVKIHKS